MRKTSCETECTAVPEHVNNLGRKALSSSKGLILFWGFFRWYSVLHSQKKGLPKNQYGYLFMTADILLLKPVDEFESQCQAIKPHAKLWKLWPKFTTLFWGCRGFWFTGSRGNLLYRENISNTRGSETPLMRSCLSQASQCEDLWKG